jgi:iron complex outermembrane receptor protein
VWEYVEGYDLKLLYGHAFRAPSFWELHDAVSGNPNLDAETVDHYEISLGAEITFSLFSRLTFFHRQGDDLITITEVVPFQHDNLSKGRSQGLEVELDYDFGKGTYLALNYLYLRPISPSPWPASPRHTGNIMANIRLSRYLNFYAQCHIEDGFRRWIGDPRDDMSGYAIVDATLIAKKFLEGYDLEIRGSVYNLLDKDYTSPMGPELPHDLPRPGRSFIIELKYKF